ncbi:hypothetical protein HanIR_Chr16g0826971 [Helianthus annuus]|nr:hypothetical protein HanIR_Chr16g0826971 [Helianthus annuus]
MKIRRVPKLLSFISSLVSFFSSSRRHQKLLVHHIVIKIASEINHIYVLLVFLALISWCIVTIFSSGSSKQSHDSEESQCHSDPFLSILELYPLSHKVDEEMLDETYCLTNVAENDSGFIPWLHKVDERILDETYSLTNIKAIDDQEFIPRLHKVDEETLDETYSLANIVADDDRVLILRSHNIHEEILDETYSLTNVVTEDEKEFIPRLVHLELIEGATGNHEDYNKVAPHVIHVKLIEGAIVSNNEIEEFKDYAEDDDYEGDDDGILDDGNDNDSESDDLTIRIEEFIAKNIRKWREEMLNDKFNHYLEC